MGGNKEAAALLRAKCPLPGTTFTAEPIQTRGEPWVTPPVTSATLKIPKQGLFPDGNSHSPEFSTSAFTQKHT